MAQHPSLLRPQHGFTLIEVAIVVLIAGILLGLGAGSWHALMEAREVAQTRSVLRQTKNCLLNHMVHNLYYPTFTAGLEKDCDNPNPSRDVDACLCKEGRTDAWGRRVRYIAGTAEDGSVLNGQYAIDRPYHAGTGVDTNATNPDPSSNATIEAGRTHSRVAFILLSLGENGKIDDNVNYGTCFPNGQHELVGTMANCTETPDFSERTDDQMLIVGGAEIRGRLSD